MHYCQYQNHIEYVHVILNSDVPAIEAKGWVHINKEQTVLVKHNNKRITQAQAKTAREELNLKVFDEDILY